MAIPLRPPSFTGFSGLFAVLYGTATHTRGCVRGSQGCGRDVRPAVVLHSVQADGHEPCNGRAEESSSCMAVSFLPKQALKLAVQKREGVVPEANSPGNFPMTNSI
jgi:hypothetical protein